jgi:CRP-like cAMP-binding protein
MEQNDIKKLSSLELFAGIAPEELSAMMHCIAPAVRKYGKGSIAAIAGDSLSGIGLVLSGEIEIARENAAGVRTIMDIAGTGSVFGEMAAFSGRRVWPATVTVRKDGALMFLPPERFLGNCDRSCIAHKRLIQNMLKIISDKAIGLNRKVEYLGIKSMRAKIATYLLEQSRVYKSATFLLPMNKNDLADYLNVSRPSMSREFSRLREEGVIDYYLSSIRLLDTEALKQMANAQ